jgi:hypothetical protein
LLGNDSEISKNVKVTATQEDMFIRQQLKSDIIQEKSVFCVVLAEMLQVAQVEQ